jgi:hypothetical protein
MISIAAEFVGKKAFKQAETSTEKLTKNVKNLAKAFGVAYSTTAVVNFGKASVMAAANDQRAQQQLALALKNVGLGRDAATSESFIQRLQTEFGIVDDKLRPAYQKLAIATQSTYESQKLLNLALDISASTGKDLDSVTSALSKAYLGSNTALSKLGIGISKADLKTKSFEDITSKLAVTFKGAATESANTFAGSVDKLGVASQNVKEIIGVGIIDALKTLSKDNSISNLATSMETLATNTADVIRGLGLMVAELQKLPGMPTFKIGMIPVVGAWLDILASKGSTSRRAAEVAKGKNPIQSGTYLNNPVTKNTTAITKLTAAQVAQTKIAKAAAMFDLKKISIAAALKGNISPDAKNRLLAMQAIENGNADLAAKYSSKINPNASMNVNVHVAGSVTSATDLVSTVRKGLLDANVAGQQTNIRRTGTTAMRAI